MLRKPHRKRFLTQVVSEEILYSKNSRNNCCVAGLGITCLELMQVLAKTNNVLIIDARNSDDYQESHIKDFDSMNIPENLIVSG